MPKQMEYRFLFVRDHQIAKELVGTIPEHWGTLSDLLGETDALAIQRKDGKEIGKVLGRRALSLLIEDTSDDLGYPLIWRLTNGTLFVSADTEAEYLGAQAYLQSKAFLTQEQLNRVHPDEEYVKTMEKEVKGMHYEEPESWKSFDFHGAASALEKKEIRPPIEKMLEELRAQSRSEVPPWAAIYREQFLSLEELLRKNPFFRNNDIWDYANLLYEQYHEAIREGDFDSGPDNFQDVRDEVLDLLHRLGLKSVNDIAVALEQTPRASDGYFERQKRTAIELATNERIPRSPVVDVMVIQLLEEIEMNYSGCIWCGKDQVDPQHICEERAKLLKPSTS